MLSLKQTSGIDFGTKAGEMGRRFSQSSIAYPTQKSSAAYQVTVPNSSLNWRDSIDLGATAISAFLGQCSRIEDGGAKPPSRLRNASLLMPAGSSKHAREGATAAVSTPLPITRLMSLTSTKNPPQICPQTSGRNRNGSRYVMQPGRYMGQWRVPLLHIQTSLVAMCSSQGLIHIPRWSLCAHLSRYLPCGACSSQLQIFLKLWPEEGAP